MKNKLNCETPASMYLFLKVTTRKKECPEITIHQLRLDDDLSQQLNVDDLRTVKDVVLEHLEGGNSVIVHCAQV